MAEDNRQVSLHGNGGFGPRFIFWRDIALCIAQTPLLLR